MNGENYSCPHCGKIIGPRTCRECGAILTPSNSIPKRQGRLCRPCKNKLQRKYYREHRERLAQMLGNKCILCGREKEMYHHTIPTNNHQNRSKYERDAESGVLVPMCNNCHYIWHEIKEYLGLGIM